MIKTKFAEYISRLERKSKKRFDAYFNELIKAIEVTTGSSDPLDNPKIAKAIYGKGGRPATRPHKKFEQY
jgi:hypothetical protein